jgi:hypothetical protein
VRRIRTGAARIVLEYGRPDLAVIPVGLAFTARRSFRSGVRVSFGERVPIEPHLARARQDSARAVMDLTASIQRGMEREVVHVDERSTADLVHASEELYRDDLVRALQAERGLAPEAIDPVRLSRTIVDVTLDVQGRDPERVARLWERMQRYQARLATYHLRDQAVHARVAPPEPPRALRASWGAVLGFPAFLYGAAVNALPYLVPRWLARHAAHRETDYATIRLLASIVAFPAFWGLETWVVWRMADAPAAVLFAVSLPVAGLLAHRYLAGVGRLESRLRFAWLSTTRSRAASRLLAERRTILDELERAKAEYLARARAAAGSPGSH